MKEQKTINDVNATMQGIKSELSIADNPIILKNENSLKTMKIIFAVVVTILLIIIIALSILLAVFVNKYNDEKDKKIILSTSEPSSLINFETSSIISDTVSSSLSDSISLSTTITITLIDDISLEEAENFLDSEIIQENHNLLNKSNNVLSETLESFNVTLNNFKSINQNINYTIPEFLDNDSDSTLKTVKSDINLYNSKYQELAENANDLTEIVSKSTQNLSIPMNNMKQEINLMIEDFENKTKSFSLPLLLEKNGIINLTENNSLRRLDLKEKIENYKNEVEKMNNLYNNFFKFINQATEVLSDNMKLIPDSVKDINDNLEKSLFEYDSLLKNFNKNDTSKQNHENLLSIKNAFLNIKEYMNNKKELVEERINILEDLYKNNTFDLDNFKIESDNITNNINDISDSIINEINEERENKGLSSIKIVKPTAASTIIADSIIKSIYSYFRILIDIEIIKQNKIISIIILINVEERTSLDLLFIMDITGSMGPYVEQAKSNLINIINKIIDDCPGIDINLGFIGYRDEEEELTGDVIDIPFTKNHNQLKNEIQNVSAEGGGDWPEDVAWAFEKALNKTWKSNTKFIVFVADAQNHGIKYGGENKTIEGRRDLEELVKELADNGVSLFCMKILEDTTTMFDIFQRVYNKYEKNQFQIIPMNSAEKFSDVVVDSAKSLYISIRYDDGSIPFEYNKKKLKIYLIEINPILSSIKNETLYTNNDGHPYASEYFEQDRELALKEIKEDLEFASHGEIEVEFVNHLIINDFPKYKNPMRLKDGSFNYKLDEETFISISKSEDENNPDKGDWHKFISSSEYKEINNNIFDYDYLIKKYNLDKLRKKNAFDQVWIYGIDILSSYETMMIGSKPFLDNGNLIIKDCKNFMIISISISRRNSNLYSIGHSLENILSFTFNKEKSDYNKIFDDDTPEKYETLNEWEKFILTNTQSKGDNAGIGNINTPFNGNSEYDYNNANEVYSYLDYWGDYPNKTAVKKKYNSDAWMKFEGNEIILNDPNTYKGPDRLYIRFWMYSLPHIDGYTKKGNLNNWWDYFINCDYISKIDIDNKTINGKYGVEVSLNYKIYYKSGSIETAQYESDDDSVEIIGDCVTFRDGKLIGSKKGSCSINVFRDGKKLSLDINIS